MTDCTASYWAMYRIFCPLVIHTDEANAHRVLHVIDDDHYQSERSGGKKKNQNKIIFIIINWIHVNNVSLMNNTSESPKLPVARISVGWLHDKEQYSPKPESGSVFFKKTPKKTPLWPYCLLERRRLYSWFNWCLKKKAPSMRSTVCVAHKWIVWRFAH